MLDLPRHPADSAFPGPEHEQDLVAEELLLGVGGEVPGDVAGQELTAEIRKEDHLPQDVEVPGEELAVLRPTQLVEGRIRLEPPCTQVLPGSALALPCGIEHGGVVPFGQMPPD